MCSLKIYCIQWKVPTFDYIVWVITSLGKQSPRPPHIYIAFWWIYDEAMNINLMQQKFLYVIKELFERNENYCDISMWQIWIEFFFF